MCSREAPQKEEHKSESSDELADGLADELADELADRLPDGVFDCVPGMSLVNYFGRQEIAGIQMPPF